MSSSSWDAGLLLIVLLFTPVTGIRLQTSDIEDPMEAVTADWPEGRELVNQIHRHRNDTCADVRMCEEAVMLAAENWHQHNNSCFDMQNLKDRLEARSKARGAGMPAALALTLEETCLSKDEKKAEAETETSVTCAYGFRFSCTGKTNLTNPSYPADQAVHSAAASSDAVSVRLFDQYQLAGTTWSTLLSLISPIPRPTQPSELHLASTAFWSEFEQVALMQASRRAGDTAASKMELPQMFAAYSMEQAALAVEADFPTKFPTALVEDFLAAGVEFDSSVIPHFTADDFVNKQVMLGRLIGWAVATVSPYAFGAKWHEGRARPEEVACAVLAGDARVSSVPPSSVAAVQALGLAASGCTDFTAYSNGAPKHPSWPAMHSAASLASVYLPVVLNLNAAQIAEAQHLDCAVATFRSFAGVHYASDNMAGLSIGQEVLRRELPQMLHREYGSSIEAVQSKIEKVINGGLYPGHVGNDWRTAPSCLYP